MNRSFQVGRGIGIFTTLAGLLTSSLAWGWADHFRITNHILGEQLQGVEVVATPFSEIRESLGYASDLEFNQSLKIDQTYNFKYELAEKTGKPVSAVEILSKYSDEPDWGMDTEIFEQYPELWRDEYAMMGGKEGTPSQSFRHMFWGKLDWRAPVQSFKIPQVFRPMGEAHERAQRFFDLAVQAKSLGNLYWGYRFLANAFHYIEDVANPFHATQLPAKSMGLMPFTSRYGDGLKDYIAQVTNVVAYYHFAVEDYLAWAIQNEPGQSLVATLKDHSQTQAPWRGFEKNNTQAQVVALSQTAARLSRRISASAMRFFPEIQVPLRELDAKEALNDLWWEQVKSESAKNPRSHRQMIEATKKMFAPMAITIRHTLQKFLDASE